ncbi:tetratricopeptide repeat protein, partial [Candidatus Binatus sp.]
LGYAYAAAGQRDSAQKILDQLNTLSTQEYVSPFAVAQIYLGLGDRDQALLWLQKAYKARSPFMLTIVVSKIFDPVRGDLRFAALVRKLGLHERPSDFRSATSPN